MLAAANGGSFNREGVESANLETFSIRGRWHASFQSFPALWLTTNLLLALSPFAG
jgi:hypothetical protein